MSVGDNINSFLREIVLDAVRRAGLDDDSDPAVVQATLDRVAAEVNHALADLDFFPGFTFTYEGRGNIVVGMKGPLQT